MAYDYIGLVNDVNRRLNEVELTTSNFASTTGYYSFAKDSVNSSIRHINQEEFEWPWNHVEASEVLTAGTARYSFPYDTKNVNMNTFRIRRDETLNVSTTKLRVLAYEEYLEKYADSEYNVEVSNRGLPNYVVRTPSREYVLYPNPNKAYELVYEYYRDSYDLENPADVPNLPEQYRYVIVDGAMYYVYQFRGDTQAAQLSFSKFEQGIKHLRSLHINRTDYIRDSRVKF
tara:strand:- start:855 stop:1544 length:690 start_codon:yes stop_codon:yes gene_type:complete